MGKIVCRRLMSFGWIACKWLFCLCGIVWKNMMEVDRGGAYVPARVAPQGRIHRSSPTHKACIFGMETPLRGRSGGHTGAAPTVSFGWITRGRLISFGWIARGWFCLFVCWENGAQEPTPSVLYFCQPRVADDRRLPWVKSWREPMPSALYFLKSICMWGIIHSSRVVMMRDEKKYNPRCG